MLVQANKQPLNTPFAIIPLGQNRETIVSPKWFKNLNQYRWTAKKSGFRFYACRAQRINGKLVFVRMHRVVARTPPDMVCHHINGDSLDNREENLLNMTLYDHTKMHSYR